MSADDQREQRATLDLDALEELERAATPGPWFAWDRGVGWHLALDPNGDRLVPEALRTDLARREDAEAIVALRNHAPDLIAAARERDQAVATLREVGRQGQEALAERDQLRATVERVRALHRECPSYCPSPGPPGCCHVDGQPLPCPTIRALDGAP